MIRISRLAAVTALACGALLVPASGGDAAATCSSLILTWHPSYPPFSWESGATLEGAGIDIVSKLASDSAVPMQVVRAGSWDAAQQAVKTGKADAIVGLYKTEARLPSFTYVEPPIAPDPSAVLVRTGETFVYKDWNSLIGKKGVANLGESFGHTFDTFAASKLNVATVHGNKAVYQALLSKQADYALMGYYAAESEMPANRGRVRNQELRNRRPLHRLQQGHAVCVARARVLQETRRDDRRRHRQNDSLPKRSQNTRRHTPEVKAPALLVRRNRRAD